MCGFYFESERECNRGARGCLYTHDLTFLFKLSFRQNQKLCTKILLIKPDNFSSVTFIKDTH